MNGLVVHASIHASIRARQPVSLDRADERIGQVNGEQIARAFEIKIAVMEVRLAVKVVKQVWILRLGPKMGLYEGCREASPTVC